MTDFGNTSPAEAVAKLLEHTSPVTATRESATDPADFMGRVLAAPVTLDRDSPACDVSAMDGFALRADELLAGPLPIAGECRIGQPPQELPPAKCLRIYTGSPVPRGADTVMRLEWVNEAEGAIYLREDRPPKHGKDIRRQGENATGGDEALHAGVALSTASVAAVASVGPVELPLYRKLTVHVLTTGDEVVSHADAIAGDEPFPAWQLRNSNGPALVSLVGSPPFVETVQHTHVGDTSDALATSLAAATAEADVVVLTGGVSKGGYDFVRSAVEQVGGELLFHGVTARPGRPTLGALVGDTPILGLPGNPVAVLCTSRRLLMPVLRRRAGIERADPPAPLVTLDAWSGKPLPLAWWRPVTLTDAGVATLASLRGSGDVIGPAMTDGFVEVTPNAEHAGPFPFYSWNA